MSNISTFNYILPEDKIAQYPLEKRDESKLLVYKNNDIDISQFKHLPQFVPPNSLLILNQTQVANARIEFFKESGARIEVFCLEDQNEINPYLAFNQKKSAVWTCLVGNAKKWKENPLTLKNEEVFLKAFKEYPLDNGSYTIRFEWNEELSFYEVLKALGNIPLPPYMNRKAETEDQDRYQTKVAEQIGSVAAPTASLHFTPEVLENIAQKNIQTTKITLHVGAGTFLPVKHENYEEHPMHYEYFELDKSSIHLILDHLKNGHTIITSGTTSTRCIESLYWIAAKSKDKIELPCKLDQFEYRSIENMNPIKALEQLLQHMETQNIQKIYGQTGIMITPDYQIQLCDALITNFHQPKSTLLLLISAFVGDHWKKMYEFALNHDFRFLSYGDSSLLWKQ